jgi:hypothetical protein
VQESIEYAVRHFDEWAQAQAGELFKYSQAILRGQPFFTLLPLLWRIEAEPELTRRAPMPLRYNR